MFQSLVIIMAKKSCAPLAYVVKFTTEAMSRVNAMSRIQADTTRVPNIPKSCHSERPPQLMRGFELR